MLQLCREVNGQERFGKILTALPSIAFLPRAKWWQLIRHMVGQRRLHYPSRIQQERAARKYIEKLRATLIAEFLSGVLFRDLMKRHDVTRLQLRAVLAEGTTTEQRRAVELNHHLRREKKRQTRLKAEKRNGQMATVGACIGREIQAGCNRWTSPGDSGSEAIA